MTIAKLVNEAGGEPFIADRTMFMRSTKDTFHALGLDAVGLGFLRLAGANAAISSGSIWRLPVMRRAAALNVGATASERIVLAGLATDDEARLRAQLA